MRSSGQFQTFLFLFFCEKILHVQKAQKAQKAQKTQRRNQAKALKAQNVQKRK